MKFMNNRNDRYPRVVDVTGLDHLNCKFCEYPDLRIGGSHRRQFICCPRCGADGPPSESLHGAIEAHLGWPNHVSIQRDPRIKDFLV